jgi:hypothetical protein
MDLNLQDLQIIRISARFQKLAPAVDSLPAEHTPHPCRKRVCLAPVEPGISVVRD